MDSKENVVSKLRKGGGRIISHEKDLSVGIKNILLEIQEKLLDAERRRFTGEIRLTFNVSQGGVSTSYIEKERENLVRKRS